MIRSYESLDKPYRRGLILGLSLAELFLILIFLLLLVALGAVQNLEERNQETEEKLQEAEEQLRETEEQLQKAEKEKKELQDSLTAIHEAIGREITVEEFGRLVKQVEERHELIEKNQKLSDQLAEAQEKIDQADKVAEILKENSIAPEDIEKILEDKESAENQLNEAREEIAKRDQVINEYAKKGQDPPCWFTNVSDNDEVDGIRQRHVKIFDVLITDTAFIVRWHDNSQIDAIDKGNEDALPHVEASFMNRGLNAEEFRSAFSKFNNAGKAKTIQSYRCRFMVDVFDATSPDNKIGYKHNLGVVESLFYKYEERGQW